MKTVNAVNHVRRFAVLFLALALLVPAGYAQQAEPGSPRYRAPLTFLQLNDVYSTQPVDGMGGLARVATFKQRLSTPDRTVLLVLAGDFLSPSVASSIFKGEQMVAALNEAGLDLATLGNHEFDFGKDVLLQRMREAKWEWVISNVTDTATGKPVGGAKPYVIRTIGGLKVGFIGLCIKTGVVAKEKLAGLRLDDPMKSAARYLPALRQRGANVIVAITHLDFEDDRALVVRFPQIDLVIGGHEHYPITATEGRTLISKAGSDAAWLARIDVNRQPGQPLERFYELVPMTSAIPDEPRTAAVVKSYEDRLGPELEAVVATSRVPLDAESLHIRAGETNLGDLFADALRAEAGSDVALLNAGSIRGDRVYPPGPLTRRTLIAMHPFGNIVCKVAVPGRVLLQALNSGVSRLPTAAGQFPQVSGLSMHVNVRAPPASRVSDVMVNGQPLDPDKIYTVGIPDFVLKGGDGYSMFAGQRELVGSEAGSLLVQALEKYVAAKREIDQEPDGRITIIR